MHRSESILATHGVLLLTPQHLGVHLRSARKAHKLTQADVGVRLALSQSRVSWLERNPDHINVRELLIWTAVVKLDIRLFERGVRDGTASSEW